MVKKKRANPYKTKSIAVSKEVMKKLLERKHELEAKKQKVYSFSELLDFILSSKENKQ